jgi:putative NIF3 family GTP cyclohydrolase 1 type 2
MQVSDTDPVGKTVIAAIRNDIAIYAAHTNFDNILTGVNSRIADKLALTSRKVLDPKPLANTGSGLIGDITPVSETAFLELLASRFNQSLVRHTPLTGKMISKVAVCGGSGSFLAANALNAGADVFVTADLKYHDFFGPDGRMLLCDIGHYESEQFTTDLFIEIILQKFPTFAVLKSEIKTNPVNYFTGKK